MSGMEREEDLDDASYQIRELYAQYGVAMYYAQVLEQGLVNALTFAQTATGPEGTRTVFDLNFEANLSVTMGRLLHRIKPFLHDDKELEVALTDALELRNFFAHSFWVTHDKDFMSFTGRERMLVEAHSARETFIAVDKRLSPVLERYLLSVGVDQELHDRTVAGELKLRLAEAAALDGESEAD